MLSGYSSNLSLRDPEILVKDEIRISDKLREFAILFCLGALIVFFGFYPDLLLDTISVSVDNLINNYNLEINKSIALK